MVTVEASFGDRCRLSVEGHAGYQAGQDIVCAGCSAVTGAFLQWAVNSPEHAKIGTLEMTPGHFVLEAAGDEFLRSALRQALLGLRQIEAQYPDNVRCGTL